MRRMPLIASLSTFLLAGTPALAFCFFCSDTTVLRGKEAQARVEAELGIPLPAGVEVVGYLEGGFQDRFVQIKLAAPATAIAVLLNRLDVPQSDMGLREEVQWTIEAADWWDPEANPGMPNAAVTLPHLGYAHLGLALSPTGAPAQAYIVGFDN